MTGSHTDALDDFGAYQPRISTRSLVRDDAGALATSPRLKLGSLSRVGRNRS
jgi:hypothetical protein